MSNLHLSIGLCLLLGLIANAPSAWSQEVKHAPTVEQCRADQQLWLDKVENNSIVELVSYTELDDWALEMADCRSVDPARHAEYDNTESEITFRQDIRLEHFLRRHNLWGQFIAEDAQGKR
jgi:hypothetical protein